jgi:hypothetical protein
MEAREIMGFVVFGIIILVISYVVSKLGGNKQTAKVDSEDIQINAVGSKPITVNKFGRYKIKMSDGQSKTIVGNLSTIIENNSVVDYHEIK